ncbi:hypothetical protein C7974DRAFT_401111 [Boeremia exigua]|uniref:uncharacterized protein n=1 Tax=Boeremia exigua TaxID=749465 RepID=UPI001E8D93D8|nr:uncharacterized protein C7974DRAFT_401111 [Boeremia exigua]KAH6618902.1 hypothetical protein C7974DRAFT_401111 [Boeremia exigua]
MSTKSHRFKMMNGDTVTALFGEATVDQQIACYTLASTAWGSYLDEDEVIAREKYLAAEALARDGGCRIWCLYRQDDHDQILSTCRTIRRSFLFREAGNTRQLEGCCISSVYTALLYQGHGLASYMLHNVAQWLDGPGEAFVSMLYSGMPRFYENLGWTTLSNIEVILDVSPWLQDTLGHYADLNMQAVGDTDIEELCARSVTLIKERPDCSELAAEEATLTVLPTADLIRYQHALSSYMGDLWHQEDPEIRGAAYNNQAWIYWFHDFRGRCLRIQHVHNAIQTGEDRVEILAALFLCAIREAKEWNFTTIATWNMSSHVRSALETLAQASVFSRSVGETSRTQRVSVRLRGGETKPSSIMMDNGVYAWNLRY